MIAVESQGQETSGGLGGKAAKAIYRGRPRSVNQEKLERQRGAVSNAPNTRIVPLSLACRIQ
jgi:hypothetical protein